MPALHGESPAESPRARRRIGVLLDALYNEYASMLVTAFEYEARAREVDLYCFAGGALHSLAGHELSRNRCYDLVSGRALDAMVVLSLSASSEVIESFLARYPSLPIVTERLAHELARLGREPALRIRDALCAAVTEFMAEQRDDIAILVARYRVPS
jgi:hypothetical protein